jgi:hypothetical protein
MSTPPVTRALKEWDVVVAALEQGRQALLVRKGGLDDPDQRIPLPQGRFWLYPTLFHARGVFLKPEHHALLVPGMHRAPREEARLVPRPDGHPRAVSTGHVALRAVAEIVAAVEAPSLQALHGLAGRTVWTEKYLTLRYRWRPQDRPLVLVLRVSALPQAVEVEERTEYGGCRSWVDLVDPPDDEAAVQLWSEDRIAAEVDAVRDALGSSAAI